jgi:AraC-like DNA-binding protein
MRATPDLSMFARTNTPLPIAYELGGGGPDRTRIVCGFLGCDERPFNPLLAALPPVIHLPAAGQQASSGWLGTVLNIAVRESGSARAGTENILARLSELMFVEAIRRYIESLPSAGSGWLAGLRDPIVGQALGALHAQPAEPWTVESLARAAAASRSVLAERFTELVGHPPMQYLALWRMQLASRFLAEGRHVASVASAVGYESEAAFSRAFKKLVGQAPARFARGLTAQGARLKEESVNRPKL